MPSAAKYGHQRLGIGEGEALVELQPQRRARRHRRSLVQEPARRAAAAGCVEHRVGRRRQAAAPVGMLVDRARQVGLLDQPSDVFERHDRERRGRAARRSRSRRRRRDRCRRLGRLSRRDARVGEGPPQRGAFSAARRSRRRPSTGPRPRRSSMSAPRHQPATVGRSCVRGHRHGVVAPFVRAAGSVAIALEPQHVHAGDAGVAAAGAERAAARCRDPRRSRSRGGDAIRARAAASGRRTDRRDRRRPSGERRAAPATAASGPSRGRSARRRHGAWWRAAWR